MIKKKIALEIFIIFIFSLTPLIWFQNNSVVLGHDSGFRLDYWSYFKTLFYSWNYIYNFGVDFSVFKGFLINQLPEFLIFRLTNSLSLTQKVTFVMWFFVIGISMYVFCYAFFKSAKYCFMRLYASIFYMFNFFLLQGWFISERAKFSLFAALPLGLLVLYKTLTKQYSILKGGILFAIIHFLLNGGGVPSLFGALLVSYSTIFIFLTYTNFRTEGVRAILFSFKTAIVFFGITFFLNAYWTFPLVNLYLTQYSTAVASTGGIEGILAWEAMVNKYASYLHLLRLQGIPDWYESPLHAYSNYFIGNPVLIAVSFIPILLIVTGLKVFNKRDENKYNRKLIYSVLILLFVGLLFTAGSHDPFGFIYVLFIKYIPGFAIFRSAFYKFAPAFWFSMIFLSAYFFQYLLNKYVSSTEWHKRIGILMIAVLLMYHFPYFTGRFFNWHPFYSTRVQVPEYVYDTAEYINTSTKADSRILILPQLTSSHTADMYTWKYWSLDVLPRQIIDRSLLANDTAHLPVISAMYSAIESRDERLLSSLFINSGTEYILFRQDISDDMGQNEKEIIEEQYNFLENSDQIRREAIFGKWIVYRLTSQNEISDVYAPETIISADADRESVGLILKNSAPKSSILSNNEASAAGISHDLQIVEAKHCELCSREKFNEVVNGIILPTFLLYPDSRFYFISEIRELQLINQADSPQSKIDVHLVLLGRRIQEDKRLREYNPEFYIDYKQTLSERVQQSLEIIKNNYAKLQPVDKLNYTYRILAYYEKYAGIIDNLSREKYFPKGGDMPGKVMINDGITRLRKSEYVLQNNPLMNTYYIHTDQAFSGKILLNQNTNTDILFQGNTVVNGTEVSLVNGMNFFYAQKSKDPEQSDKSTILIKQSTSNFTDTEPQITYTKVNPAEYKINIKGAADPYLLRLNEKYDRGWVLLQTDSGGIIDNLTALPNISAHHIEVDGYVNGWLLERKGDYQLTLQYRPFAVFILGLWVSGITIVMILIILGGIRLWKSKLSF